MFIISHIKVTSPHPLFDKNIYKFLRMQSGSLGKRNPFPAKFINQHQIQWQAQMIFSDQHYGKAIAFELYQKHRFGYSAQEMTGVMQGEIKIEKDMQFNNYAIYSYNKASVVAYLSINIKHHAQTPQKQIKKKVAKQQVLTVKSIVAHLPPAINKKIRIQLCIGKRSCKTTANKSYCGYLVFTDVLIIDKLDIQTQGKMIVHQLRGQSQIRMGQGRVNLEQVKPQRSVILYDINNQLLGQAYIDGFQQLKQNMGQKSSSLPNYLNKLSPRPLSLDGSTSMSRIMPQFKRLSVVKTNQSIVFSTANRFNQPKNPQQLSQTRSFRKTKVRNKPHASQLRASRLFNKFNGLSMIEEELESYALPMIWEKH